MALPVLVRLVVVVWRRWVLAPLVLLAVVAVSLAVAVLEGSGFFGPFVLRGLF